METTQQKPKFQPQKVLNTAHLVTFESSEPFYAKENDYGKMSYGYNVLVNGQAHVWFASEAINNLLKLKNIAQGEEISIEFKGGTNDTTGQPYKIWLLNGKSAQDLAQEAPYVAPATPEPISAPVAPAIATPSSTDEELSQEDKVALMWAKYIEDGGLPF